MKKILVVKDDSGDNLEFEIFENGVTIGDGEPFGMCWRFENADQLKKVGNWILEAAADIKEAQDVNREASKL